MIVDTGLRMRRLAALAALLVFEIAAAVGLHVLGRVPVLALPQPLLSGAAWQSWLVTGRVEDCLVALLRAMALGFVVYLLLSTLAYLLQRLAGARAALGLAGRTALPAVRLIVDRALAVTAVTAVIVARPAVAAPLPVPQPDVVVADASGEPLVLPPVLVPPARAGPAAAGPARVEPAPAPATGAAVHVVAAGESLWRIAEERVARHHRVGDAPPALTVHDYWTRLLVTNESLLRSEDPDLLYPGERLILPPLRPATAPT